MQFEVSHKIFLSDPISSAYSIYSILLQINHTDNPYLDHIVRNLWQIICPGSKVCIPPFPLEWMFTPFERDYYTYNGSLSQPPCNEIVTWIVQQEPIAISLSQVKSLILLLR